MAVRSPRQLVVVGEMVDDLKIIHSVAWKKCMKMSNLVSDKLIHSFKTFLSLILYGGSCRSRHRRHRDYDCETWMNNKSDWVRERERCLCLCACVCELLCLSVWMGVCGCVLVCVGVFVGWCENVACIVHSGYITSDHYLKLYSCSFWDSNHGPHHSNHRNKTEPMGFGLA